MDEKKPDFTLAKVVTGESDATKQLVDPKASKKASRMDLIELASEVQKADAFVKCAAGNKLQVIAEQIRFLQEQARRVLEDAKEANHLHHAQCNFKKIPGKMYYLYRRNTGQAYFSMLSPKEWGSGCPHDFLGAYRLEHDMSWTKAEDIEVRNQELTVIDKILQCGVPSLEYLAADPHTSHSSEHSGPHIEEAE